MNTLFMVLICYKGWQAKKLWDQLGGPCHGLGGNDSGSDRGWGG